MMCDSVSGDDIQEDDEEEEEEELSLGQETLVTARPGHAGEFSQAQLGQYSDDTLIIHDEQVRGRGFQGDSRPINSELCFLKSDS